MADTTTREPVPPSGESLRRLRPQSGGAAEVTTIELFYDLVYVLAVTQLTHHLLGHLTLRGAFETLLLLLAVWGAWIQITWITNYFDLNARPARLVLIGLMFAGLVMSSSLNQAFGAHGLGFAAGLSASILGAQLAALAGVDRTHPLAAVFQRAFIWWLPVCALLIAGALAHGDARDVLWVLAIAVYYFATATGFPLPRLGRSLSTDYTISGDHIAHRCFLFITIALGESILVIGTQFDEISRFASTVTAFAVAFVGSVAFWWIYFDRTAGAGLQVISTSADPGRLGITAYTYFHIPMVAGVIVAAADYELAIAHPGDDLDVATASLILGGPALFLIGQALFKWAVWGYIPPSRWVPILGLVALIPVAFFSTALLLLTLVTAVVVVAAWLSSHAPVVQPALALERERTAH